MKAKKMFALLLSGAMALTMGVMAACDTGNNGGGNTTDGPGGGGGGGGGTYTVDTTEYYLAGGGGGDLKQNSWNETNHVLKLVRDETADHNLFNITIDMYKGDAFQIVHDDSWAGQMGITYFQDVEEDPDLGNVVKNEEGEVVFVGTGMFKVDITLQDGHDGTYTFSLHTFPDEDKDPYITYTKDAELSALQDMYVVSDMNDFGFKPAEYAASHMVQNGSIWQLAVTITEADLKRNEDGDIVTEGAEYVAIAVHNAVENENGKKVVTCDSTLELTTFIDGDEYNLLGAGVYTFRYNAEEGVLTISEGAYEMYFIGSMNGWSTAGEAEYKLTQDVDGNWYGYLKLEEAAEVKLYNLLTDKYFTNDPADGNIKLEAGEYFFRFTTEEEKVEYEECAYYIAGTLEDTVWGVCETSPKLVWDETAELYTVEITNTGSIEFKVVYGSVLGGVKGEAYWYGNDEGQNVAIFEAGDYTVTFDPATKKVDVVEALSDVTVSFDLNYPEGVEGPEGQVAPADQTISKRATATKPDPDPELEGYNFLGWYTDKECTEVFEFTTPVTKDMTLYARWVAKEVVVVPNVTFNLNYTGAPAANVVATVNGKVAKPEDPIRKGYLFLGWYTSVSGSVLFDFDTTVMADTNVYAHWVYAYHIVGDLPNDDRIGYWDTSDYGLTLELVPDSNHPLGTYFKIELTLYLGNAFKIVGPNNWNDGFIAGGGCLKGDRSQLAGSDNIEVKAPGNYVIYFSIDGNWEITWSYEAFASTSNNDMYLVMGGTETKMAFDGASKWVASIKVRNGVTVKLVDKGNGNKEYAVNLTSNGDYEVSFNTSDNSVTVTEVGYFIAGAFTNPSWGVGATSPKLTWNEELGAYAVEVTTTTANAQCKVVTGTISGITNWNDDDNRNTAATEYVSVVSGNLSIKTAGTYIIAYDTTTGKITVTPKAA